MSNESFSHSERLIEYFDISFSYQELNNKKRDEAQDIARFNMAASEAQKKKYEPSNEFQVKMILFTSLK